MPDADSLMVHGSTLEALQSHHGSSQRTRPPDIDVVTAEENRVPLRPERANKRESRLGLRSLFGRSKTPKDTAVPASPRDVPKSVGIRASIADMSNWPYGHSAPKSEATLTAAQTPRPLPTMAETPQPSQTSHHHISNGGGKTRAATASSKNPREPYATWHPPPLFKAYPQAIKYMTLPATSVSADSILRIHDRKTNTGGRDELTEPMSPATVDPGEERAGEKEKPKRRHRRNSSWSATKFDWTNKIYILVTSGYLLQYAAEGAFDRLPEKALQLGRNSAAFASDVIPGRHWVIQVSSAMDSEGSANSDSRSLFSRFRVTERRQAANFLMVFETANDMESWIMTLRREIEVLGGKKSLSETGKPKVEDQGMPLKQQTSQRTLVVRDPTRFSRILSNPQAWEEVGHQEGSAATLTEPEARRDRSLDDISTTNSVGSHDGRQLDSLRDSSNRLSFISSGQRTVVTSTGSSPACSPTVESFPPHLEDTQGHNAEARLRPNASAILDRRQSLQTMTPFVDLKGGSATIRSQPGAPSTGSDAAGAGAGKIAPPNFSVPQSSSRRFSYMKNGHPEVGAGGIIREGEMLPRQVSRKAPPTTLPIARPLSMVADQPSPMEEVPERPATRHGGSQMRSPTSFEAIPVPRIPSAYDIPSRRSSRNHSNEPQAEVQAPRSPRRLSGFRILRGSEKPPMTRNFTAPTRPVPVPKMRSHPSLPRTDESERYRSSLDLHGTVRCESPSAMTRSLKRASTHSVVSEKSVQVKPSSTDLPLPYIAEPPPQPAPPPSAPLPPIPTSASNPHLKVDLSEKALFNRRSMPQLNEGPPPAPPPTCALPPIPQKTLR